LTGIGMILDKTSHLVKSQELTGWVPLAIAGR